MSYHSISPPLPSGLGNGGTQHSDVVLPWYKKPSPLWPLVLLPFITSAVSSTFAPRIEVYTQLVCATHKPGIYNEHFLLSTAVIDGCASDPTVQAEVAKLSAVITACAGALACITTGWWGAFSDRHGRTYVMGIPIAGLFLTDLNFILTSHFWKYLPGGYWSLAIGPLIEGSLGGIIAATAALNAYIADTTNSTTRSRFFSLSMGLIFAGMSIGPTLGSLLIHTTGHTLSVFYVDGAAHLIFALCILFVVPESRSPTDCRLSRVKYATEKPSGSLWRRFLAFLSPLSVFWPSPVLVEGSLKVGRNWDLLLIALSYGLAVTIMDTFNVRFQYTSATFGWSSEDNGYWFSAIGVVRALFLTLILPTIIKLFNPAPSLTSSHVSSETQPLLPHPQPASFRFEIRLAQASLLVVLSAYIAMALTSTSRVFTIASLFDAMGAGFSPAVQTVALGKFLRGKEHGESGRLWGGLGVVQALCADILGPAGYGLVYMKTAGSFPPAIFVVSCVAVVLSLGLLTYVKTGREAVVNIGEGENVDPAVLIRD
ncbi:major facilitator superfamily domain-containing protein [Collybia nuda]|uniref:Major facilitator superfamily domain-containing protein n=1 Tax=Collybia nuda TaxID=64659 RepID=A0A9P5YKD8_9AGAR|nr:major facilitator superfamily domain-containing protein [Collybia nuda]